MSNRRRRQRRAAPDATLRRLRDTGGDECERSATTPMWTVVRSDAAIFTAAAVAATKSPTKRLRAMRDDDDDDDGGGDGRGGGVVDDGPWNGDATTMQPDWQTLPVDLLRCILVDALPPASRVMTYRVCRRWRCAIGASSAWRASLTPSASQRRAWWWPSPPPCVSSDVRSLTPMVLAVGASSIGACRDPLLALASLGVPVSARTLCAAAERGAGVDETLACVAAFNAADAAEIAKNAASDDPVSSWRDVLHRDSIARRAAADGREDVVRMCFDAPYDDDVEDGRPGASATTPYEPLRRVAWKKSKHASADGVLQAAAGAGRDRLVRVLCEEYAVRKLGDSLTAAARNDRESTVRLLCDMIKARSGGGAEVVSVRKAFDRALEAAIKCGHERVTRVLYGEYGARDRHGGALIDAAYGGHLRLLRLLYEEQGACDVDAALLAAVGHGHVDAARMLLDEMGACDVAEALLCVARSRKQSDEALALLVERLERGDYLQQQPQDHGCDRDGHDCDRGDHNRDKDDDDDRYRRARLSRALTDTMRVAARHGCARIMRTLRERCGAPRPIGVCALRKAKKHARYRDDILAAADDDDEALSLCRQWRADDEIYSEHWSMHDADHPALVSNDHKRSKHKHGDAAGDHGRNRQNDDDDNNYYYDDPTNDDDDNDDDGIDDDV